MAFLQWRKQEESSEKKREQLNKKITRALIIVKRMYRINSNSELNWNVFQQFILVSISDGFIDVPEKKIVAFLRNEFERFLNPFGNDRHVQAKSSTREELSGVHNRQNYKSILRTDNDDSKQTSSNQSQKIHCYTKEVCALGHGEQVFVRRELDVVFCYDVVNNLHLLAGNKVGFVGDGSFFALVLSLDGYKLFCADFNGTIFSNQRELIAGAIYKLTSRNNIWGLVIANDVRKTYPGQLQLRLFSGEKLAQSTLALSRL